MKKLFVITLFLAIAATANAALKISVNGTVDAAAVTVLPSETAVIDISNDGQTSWEPGLYFLGIGVIGNASLDISGTTILYPATTLG